MRIVKFHWVRYMIAIIVTCTLWMVWAIFPSHINAQDIDTKDTLQPQELLGLNSSITSANGKFKLIMQGDGNLVLYELPGLAIWATNTRYSGANRAIMQADGNFVVYRDTRPVWASNTAGSSASLKLQDDGNLVVYRENGVPAWSSRTNIRVLETITDRCSGDVLIASRFSDDIRDAADSGVLLSNASRYTSPSPLTLAIAGHTWIRWWCHSTTGNWADPGTWRLDNFSIVVGCDTDLSTGEVSNCSPKKPEDWPIPIPTTSSVNGWTPERSRCASSRTIYIDAFLGQNRLLQIRCWGR